MLTVRDATESDLTLLREIGMQTFADSFGGENAASNIQAYLESSFNSDQISRELKEEGSRFFLAFDDKTIAGYAKVRSNSPQAAGLRKNSIELQRIYVVKNYIGKRVGAKLMQSCLDYAMQNGYEEIWLGVWERNNKAHQFYFRWGFEKFGEQKFQLGEDAQTDWLMKKSLSVDADAKS
ncbi:MAG: GNAT family N-acetyltransferase [Cyclobacteriaceae bacterium]